MGVINLTFFQTNTLPVRREGSTREGSGRLGRWRPGLRARAAPAKQVEAEASAPVVEAPLELEPCRRGQVVDLLGRVLVGVLGVDPFAGLERDFEVERVDPDPLTGPAFEEALDAARVRVVVDAVAEPVEVEVRPELAVRIAG